MIINLVTYCYDFPLPVYPELDEREELYSKGLYGTKTGTIFMI